MTLPPHPPGTLSEKNSTSILKTIDLPRLLAGTLLLALLSAARPARAERTVLGPTGDTLAPESYRSEIALDPQGRVQDRIWLQYSTPQGIELETERLDLTGERKKRYSLNIQYPLTYSLVRNLPAISLGVRDLTGTGVEHGALYIAATRSISLSDRQHQWLRDLKIDAGAGTGRIGGLFVGIQTQLASGLRVQAELYRRRPNITVALPISRHFDARAYSLDSHIFYGLSFSVQR
jgi:hypothetical protein